MPDVAQLVVDLRLQDQLTAGVAAAKGQLQGLDQQAKATGTTLGGLGSSFGAIAKAGATAFVAFKALDIGTDFFAGAIQGAKDEEVGIDRLTASLKANVAGFNGSTDAIEQAISAREDLAFSDGELRDSLGSIVAVTHDVNRGLDVQNVAMDLARFKQVSLKDATQALVTVEAGRYRGLAQLGITLRQGATQTEALAAVEAVAAGQADKFGQTAEGAFQSASIAVHDLQEDIGSDLLPVIENAARGLHDVLKPTANPGSTGSFLGAALGAVFDPTHITEHVKEVTDAIVKNAVAVQEDATHIQGLTDIQADQIGRLKEAGRFILQDTAYFAQWTNAAKDTGVGLDGVTQRAIALAQGFDVSFPKMADQVKGVKDQTQILADVLAALPTTVTVNVDEVVRIIGDAENGAGIVPVPGAGSGPAGNTDFGSLFGSTGSLDGTAADPRVKVLKALGGGASDARRRAQELAAAYKNEVSNAFDNAKRTSETLFDALDARIDKSIARTLKLAQTQHDSTVQTIADNLKAAQAADAAPVTAAEQALAATQAAQQRRGLVESLTAAQNAFDSARQAPGQSNADFQAQAVQLARALRDAKEALANYDAQVQINTLKAKQQGLDAAAQSVADAATAKADADLASAKAKAQKDSDAETVAARKRKDDFDRALANLQAADLKNHQTPAQIQAGIAALQAKFGITTDALGFHHIEDPLVTAIKGVKVEPKVTITNHNTFKVTLNGRDIAAAIASGANPTQSGSVRAGQARP